MVPTEKTKAVKQQNKYKKKVSVARLCFCSLKKENIHATLFEDQEHYEYVVQCHCNEESSTLH